MFWHLTQKLKKTNAPVSHCSQERLDHEKVPSARTRTRTSRLWGSRVGKRLSLPPKVKPPGSRMSLTWPAPAVGTGLLGKDVRYPGLVSRGFENFNNFLEFLPIF